jgi:hypothetical protein
MLENEGKYYVPWKTIVTEISHCSTKFPKHSHRKHGWEDVVTKALTEYLCDKVKSIMEY